MMKKAAEEVWVGWSCGTCYAYEAKLRKGMQLCNAPGMGQHKGVRI